MVWLGAHCYFETAIFEIESSRLSVKQVKAALLAGQTPPPHSRSTNEETILRLKLQMPGIQLRENLSNVNGLQFISGRRAEEKCLSEAWAAIKTSFDKYGSALFASCSFLIQRPSPIRTASAIISNSPLGFIVNLIGAAPFSPGARAAVVYKCDQIVQTAHGTFS
jgi:hypothetical protein